MDLQFIEKHVGPLITSLPDPDLLARLSTNKNYDLSKESEDLRNAVTSLTEQLTNSGEGAGLDEKQFRRLVFTMQEAADELQHTMKMMISRNTVQGADRQKLQSYLDNVKPVYKTRRDRTASEDYVKFEDALKANRDLAVSEVMSKAMNQDIDVFEELLNAAVARNELEEDGFASERERKDALENLASSMAELIGGVDEMNTQPKMKETYGRIGKLFRRAEEVFGSDFTGLLSRTIENDKNKYFLAQRYADDPSYSSDFGFGKNGNTTSAYDISKGLRAFKQAEADFLESDGRVGRDPWEKTKGKIKSEWNDFINGPKGCDPESMLEWTGKCSHILAYDDTHLRQLFQPYGSNEKSSLLFELGNAWIKPFRKAADISTKALNNMTNDPKYTDLLVSNKPEKIDNEEIRRGVNDFNEKYDRYLRSLSRGKVNECFDEFGLRIDSTAAKRELEYNRTVYTHAKGEPFATVHNLDGKKGFDYVLHMHSGKVDLSAGAIEGQLAALQADLKKTDPFWLMTNSRQFNNMKDQLSDTLKTFQALKQNPHDAEMSAKAAQQMEKLAEMANVYSERKKEEYPTTKKGRDELRFTATSKLTSLAATYVLAPKVMAFREQAKQLGTPGADPGKMAETFVDALKSLEKCPKQPDLKNQLAMTYLRVSRSPAAKAFGEKVASLVSDSPELKNTDLNKLKEHGLKVADVFTKHKQTLEKTSPANQLKVGYSPKEPDVSGVRLP